MVILRIPIITPIVDKIKAKKQLSEWRKKAQTEGLWFYPFTDEEKERFVKTVPPRFWSSEHVQKIYFLDPRGFDSVVADLRDMDRMKVQQDKQKLKQI